MHAPPAYLVKEDRSLREVPACALNTIRRGQRSAPLCSDWTCLLTWMMEPRKVLKVLRMSELIPRKLKIGGGHGGPLVS